MPKRVLRFDQLASGETVEIREWLRIDRINALQEIDSIINRVHQGDVIPAPNDHFGHSDLSNMDISVLWEQELQKTGGKYIPGDPEYVPNKSGPKNALPRKRKPRPPKPKSDLKLLKGILKLYSIIDEIKKGHLVADEVLAKLESDPRKKTAAQVLRQYLNL